jgi:hypothetical protein
VTTDAYLWAILALLSVALVLVIVTARRGQWSKPGFDVRVLPGLPPPGSIMVIRGADFDIDDAEVARQILNFYSQEARRRGVPVGTPADAVLPLILHLPPEGEAVIWSEDVDANMAKLGWVR